MFSPINNPTGAASVSGALLSALRQWVELDPANGGPPVDDPLDDPSDAPSDREAAAVADAPPADAKRPAG